MLEQGFRTFELQEFIIALFFLNTSQVSFELERGTRKTSCVMRGLKRSKNLVSQERLEGWELNRSHDQ